MSAAGGDAVVVRGVHKRFAQGQVQALQDIDLEISPREFVSLIGPSGCGKSTLLRIIGDLTQPTSGTVVVNGKPAPTARRRCAANGKPAPPPRRDRDYGIVFQDSVLYDWRTVAKNIALPLEMDKWDKGRRRDRGAQMFALVELGGFGAPSPGQVSGGMQRRVSTAGALSFSPALLLMDEP